MQVATVIYCPHTHTHTHSLTLSLTHSLTHTFTHSLTHSLIHSLTHILTHSHTYSLTHSLTHTLTHSHTHSLTLSYDPDSEAPHNTEECRHEIFNFFDEFPGYEKLLKDAENFMPNISEIDALLRNLSDVSFLPCQQALYDLPLYYMGK